MKKFLIVALSVMMMLTASFAMADAAAPEVKMGQAICAAHGDKSFAVATVAMEGDKIVACYLDEFQFMAADGNIGVPNSDGAFGEDYPEGKVLASKKVNSETYSANMAERGGATQTLIENFTAIEEFCTGKTVAELQAAIDGAAEGTDVVSGCTLVDSVGYIKAFIEAANSIAA